MSSNNITIYFKMRIILLEPILILIASDYLKRNTENFSDVGPFHLLILVEFLNTIVDSITFSKFPPNKYFKRHCVISIERFRLLISTFKILPTREIVFIGFIRSDNITLSCKISVIGGSSK